MPRTKNIIATNHITSLQKAIEHIFGKRVMLYSDCVMLASDVYIKTGVRISQQTLRRFFGLIKTDLSPSLSTLNVLALYAGYQDWIAFIKKGKDGSKLKFLSTEETALIKDFYNTSVEPSKDINFYQAAYTFAKKILQSKPSETFLKELAVNKTAQTFFYEMFPYLDGSAGNYGYGINKYLKHKKFPEAQIFGHSFLFLKSFLTEDTIGFEKEFPFLQKAKVDLTIHPLPVARLIGSQFLYYYATNNETKYIEWIGKSTKDFLNHYEDDNPLSSYFPAIIL